MRGAVASSAGQRQARLAAAWCRQGPPAQPRWAHCRPRGRLRRLRKPLARPRRPSAWSSIGSRMPRTRRARRRRRWSPRGGTAIALRERIINLMGGAAALHHGAALDDAACPRGVQGAAAPRMLQVPNLTCGPPYARRQQQQQQQQQPAVARPRRGRPKAESPHSRPRVKFKHL